MPSTEHSLSKRKKFLAKELADALRGQYALAFFSKRLEVSASQAGGHRFDGLEDSGAPNVRYRFERVR